MAEDANHGQLGEESSAMSTDNKKESGNVKKQRKGILSRIWNGLFRIRGEDFEKRLQHISKEEASLLARMKDRSQNWRTVAKLITYSSVLLEILAVVFAITKTRSPDLNWKMRAFWVSPMFLLPGVSYVIYSTWASFIRIWDRKDQKTLERLRAERQTKINELKERTNYYATQQLIQRYDPDPAAKAAAATVLASKLGADSGLNVYVGDESNLNPPSGKSNDIQLVQSSGLRNRKQSHTRSNSAGSIVMHQSAGEMTHDLGVDSCEFPVQNQALVVEHHQGSTAHDGGWIARIAALLVGEDPTQSYALICGNCHMHNGLARKEDFPYVTYYCPHCHALNRSGQLEEHATNFSSDNVSSPSPSNGDVIDNSSHFVTDNNLISGSSITAVVETKESSEMKVADPI
ncbi:uncharacterized protein At2g24330-like [Macadamia integrifolia]|uniref:uncharacterized protein At2g24330-like n=1 Tax=Macadamia integrifolia TaxID=60698 RepID=UPI001C4E95B2|nr:uncharacterized protein At2g24330-like [Macadamia integrifolia]